jgi:hypothetical protein
MEHLQVIKHSLRRRRAMHSNYQILYFMCHIVGTNSRDESDDDFTHNQCPCSVSNLLNLRLCRGYMAS